MKRYWDLSNTERAALTADQVEAFIPVELMEAGVLKPEPPVLAVVPPEPELNKITLWRVCPKNGFGPSIDVGFSTTGQAETFLGLVPFELHQNYPLDVKTATSIHAENSRLESVEVASPDSFEMAKRTIAVRAEAIEKNAKATADYQKELQAAADATALIWDDWNKCKDVEYDLEKVRKTFREYKALANGADDVAYKFLLKVYPAEKIEAAFGRSAFVATATAPVVPGPMRRETPGLPPEF